MISDILWKINIYNQHTEEYSYYEKRKKLSEQGVVFNIVDSNELKKKWIELFTKDISNKTKKEIYFNYYYWHIFSYNILKAKNRKNARYAFNSCRKKRVYVFYQNSEEGYLIENAHLLKSSDFDMDDDIYLFDADEKWTYIHTHEDQCGPYFYHS